MSSITVNRRINHKIHAIPWLSQLFYTHHKWVNPQKWHSLSPPTYVTYVYNTTEWLWVITSSWRVNSRAWTARRKYDTSTGWFSKLTSTWCNTHALTPATSIKAPCEGNIHYLMHAANHSNQTCSCVAAACHFQSS